jgi:hypothetical protein
MIKLTIENIMKEDRTKNIRNDIPPIRAMIETVRQRKNLVKSPRVKNIRRQIDIVDHQMKRGSISGSIKEANTIAKDLRYLLSLFIQN